MKRDLQIVKALIKEIAEGAMCTECGGAMYEGMCTECGYMEETLHGGQKKLDVAPPFGKLTGADFKKLRSTKKEDINSDSDARIQKMVDNNKHFYNLGYETGYSDAKSGRASNPMTENHEGADHEVSMANNSIDSIIWAAHELKKHLQGSERDIPAWIQDHITNAENYILQAAKNYHEYGAEEAPEGDLGLTNEDLMSTLGGERPFGDSEMRKNIVEPNLGPDYDAYIMFQGPEGQYDQAKQKYVKDMEGWKQLYRSSNYQGNAYISPDGNVIKAAILGRGGIVGAIYVKKEAATNEMSLQEMIKKVGSKYNVYSKKGKKLGSHPSKKKAQKQLAAIEISKQGK